MKQELLDELMKSFDSYFDNFKRNNGSEALKISLDCIECNYLDLKEDDETTKEELKIIEEHLDYLEFVRRSCEYLSGTRDLEIMQTQITSFKRA